MYGQHKADNDIDVYARGKVNRISNGAANGA